MPAVLTAQSFAHAGGAITYATGGGTLTASGNTTPCGAGLALLVKNGGGSPITLQMVVPAGITVDGMAVVTPFTLAISNGADAILPLVPARYQDPTTGLATFGFSATPTSVSAACVSTAS